MEELDWSLVAPESNLSLIVPRAVQEEIDRLKSDGNGRRAKRARNANSILRSVVLSEAEQLVIREKPLEVVLTISPPLPTALQSSGVVHLDPQRPDDAVMIELLNYRETFQDKDAGLLTHDTVPLMTAKRLNIPFVLVPDEWLLKPEPSTEEKKIRELQTQIAAYENSLPKIRFLTPDLPKAAIAKTVVAYPPLTEAELDTLMGLVQGQYPMQKASMQEPKEDRPAWQRANFMHSLGKFVPPSEAEIKKYEEEEYPEWLLRVRAKIVSMSERIAAEAAAFTLPFEIENFGNAPAVSLYVRIDVSEGLLILPPGDDDDEEDNGEGKSDSWDVFPLPPNVPSGSYKSPLLWQRDFGGINDYSFLNRPLPMIYTAKPTSADEFLWKNARPKTAQSRWEFTCESFRHKTDPEVFELVISSLHSKPTGGAMVCRVAANNLIDNVELTIPIKLTYETADTFKQIRSMWNI